MASASKLRTVSRFLGVLALVVALIRLCLAVMRHTAIPWTAVIVCVVVCALLWMVPVAGGTGGTTSAVP